MKKALVLGAAVLMYALTSFCAPAYATRNDPPKNIKPAFVAIAPGHLITYDLPQTQDTGPNINKSIQQLRLELSPRSLRVAPGNGAIEISGYAGGHTPRAGLYHDLSNFSLTEDSDKVGHYMMTWTIADIFEGLYAKKKWNGFKKS